MKQHRKILLACLFLAWNSMTGLAQTTSFFLVAPTASIDASFPGAGQNGSMPPGYSFVEITAANSAVFMAMPLPRLQYVYNNLQPGTNLYTQKEKILNNSGREVDVEYFLTDDQTALPGGSGPMFATYIDTADNNTYVWPASNGSDRLATGRYLGWVMVGEHQLNQDQAKRPGGIQAIDEVILHETSHTQWVGEGSKWPSDSVNSIAYGADNIHRVNELLGDQETAINEGLATFYGFTMNQPGLNDLLLDFTSTDPRYYVEGRSVLAGDPVLNAVPTRNRFNFRGHYPDGGPIVGFSFPWRDVPGFYLLFAESSSTAFYSLYWQNAYQNQDTAFSFIGFSANAMHDGRMKRYLTYSVNRLALKMEDYNQSTEGQADPSRTSSMLPFALLDLVTHFGMAEADYKADYDMQYPDRQPKAYAEYFTRRNAIQALVQADLDASPIRFSDAMAKIKNYCSQADTIF